MQKLLVQKVLVEFNLLVTSTNMGHCAHPLVQVFYCVFERQQTTSRAWYTGGPTPLPRDGVTMAGVRVESEGPAESVAIYSHRNRENTAIASVMMILIAEAREGA